MKTICIYNYYEKDYKYKQNCLYFLKHGLNSYSDFLFVVNGKSTITFPDLTNIRVIYRNNIGYDFMAFSHGLNNININYYDYFLFINTSVRGPFVKNIDNWQNIFTSMINRDTKLIGTTINIFCGKKNCHWSYENKLNELGIEKPYTHIQSMMFAMDKECLLYLKDRIFIEEPLYGFTDTIIYKEIMMSQFVLKNNWNINCTAPLYKNYDYRTLKIDMNYSSNCGDSCYHGGYFGKSLQPYEVVFIKTNRDIYPISYKFLIMVITFLIITIITIIIAFIIV
jgi:hypothetical protein